MLSKLLKYDFKALKRILAPLLLCVLGASVLGSLGLTILIRQDNKGNELLSFGQIVSAAITFFLVFTIIAAIAVAAVVIFVHFYKSFVTNEAYLTFTLPVSIKDHMLSKMISGYIWFILSGLVVVFSIFVIAFFGTASSGFINSGLISDIYDLLKLFTMGWNYNMTIMIILIISIIFIAPMTTLLQYYTAIVIGGVIAKKNKMLAAIAFVFVINMVTQILYQIMYFITLSVNMNTNFESSSLSLIAKNINMTLAFYIIVYIGLGIAYFFVSKNLLENKLNLE